ncbi:hypothetical protein D3C79_962550 [compost metagenome]
MGEQGDRLTGVHRQPATAGHRDVAGTLQVKTITTVQQRRFWGQHTDAFRRAHQQYGRGQIGGLAGKLF